MDVKHFRRYAATRRVGGVLRREAPNAYRIGGRTLSGRIDAVDEADDELVVIDHRSFPGARIRRHAPAMKYFGQLRLNGEALRAASDKSKPVRTALRLPIVARF